MNVYEISKIKQHNMGYSKSFFDDLERFFQDMGIYIDVDADSLNELFWDYSWGQIAKAFFKPSENTWYSYYEHYNSYEFEYEALFRALMEHFGFTVLEYEEATTFSNSGLDVIVMSFVVSDGINIYTSLNNIHERY